jgi:hypothetical protein
MKDYSIDDANKNSYITGLKREKDGTYTITFADGRKFSGISAYEENLRKIEKIQESQAANGVKNISVYKCRRNNAVCQAGVCGATLFGGLSAVANLTPIASSLIQSPVALYSSIGAITILGTIPFLAKISRENSRIKEGNKIRFRNENREELDSFRNYYNSLAGIDSAKAAKLCKRRNPFSILHIDDFTLEDLETIVDNIEREKAFQFVYTKEDTSSSSK